MRCVAALVALTALLIAPRAADACSFVPLEIHELAPSLDGVDTASPAEPVVASLDIIRRPNEGSGCGAHNSCDGSGEVVVQLQPGDDDRASSAELGYRIEVVAGRLPEGMSTPEQPVRTDNGSLYLLFSDTDQAIDITLELTAIDRAGNESAPITVQISDGGSGGCRTTRTAIGSWFVPLAAALLLAVRRRHRGKERA